MYQRIVCKICNKTIKKNQYKRSIYPLTDKLHKPEYLHILCWKPLAKVDSNKV